MLFFSCPHTVLPTEHSLGVVFFFLPSPRVMLYFLNTLSSGPAYPTCHIVCMFCMCLCICTDWLMVNFVVLVLVTSDNKGILLWWIKNNNYWLMKMSLSKSNLHISSWLIHLFIDRSTGLTVYNGQTMQLSSVWHTLSHSRFIFSLRWLRSLVKAALNRTIEAGSSSEIIECWRWHRAGRTTEQDTYLSRAPECDHFGRICDQNI